MQDGSIRLLLVCGRKPRLQVPPPPPPLAAQRPDTPTRGPLPTTTAVARLPRSWFEQCHFDNLCEDCSKCGLGCPHYLPYESEVLPSHAAAAVDIATVEEQQQQPKAQQKQAAPSQGWARRLSAVESAPDETGRKGKVGVTGSRTDTLRLLPGEDEVELRVFVDRTIIEAYWMDGRVAITSAIQPAFAREGLPQTYIFSDTDGVEVKSADAYAMGSIWVSKEEVLQTPRVNSKQQS